MIVVGFVCMVFGLWGVGGGGAGGGGGGGGGGGFVKAVQLLCECCQ